MTYVKYTREMLTEAVAASTSMSEVLRHLGLPMNGGAHAHLRRRIERFGIDKSHFLRATPPFRFPRPLRRGADQVLILRPQTSNREKPAALRRALQDLGQPYRCTGCGNDGHWNGRPLVLHVDHINGQMWDCRPDNVRFLCPNCHSQTPTYAGRKSKQSKQPLVRVDDQGNPVENTTAGISADQIVAILGRVERQEIGSNWAARLIGCSRSHLYRLRKQLAEEGTVAAITRRSPMSDSDQRVIVSFALRHPRLGPRRIAAALAHLDVLPFTPTESTVGNVLARAALSTEDKRVAAAEVSQGPNTV
jgi:predicted RNA-binding Zn-ribbon protein involved in translation (DUF1610 family)